MNIFFSFLNALDLDVFFFFNFQTKIASCIFLKLHKAHSLFMKPKI